MSKIQIESNSQLPGYSCHLNNGCIYHVKDTNRKQFTTTPVSPICNSELYLSCQRYKSKAIHNARARITIILCAVFIMSKIQIESNSQLLSFPLINNGGCIYHVKDTNRKQFTTFFRESSQKQKLYLSCQRYKSKAIHNYASSVNSISRAVFIMSKIQIESNSQHILRLSIKVG